jgi:DNA-binding MarR family transcriptional regulator
MMNNKALAKRKSLRFTDKVYDKILKGPTNEALIAADLRVTMGSVTRVIDHAIKYGYVERIDLNNGDVPHLLLTKDGREQLAVAVHDIGRRLGN